jgi:hypothetical protein
MTPQFLPGELPLTHGVTPIRMVALVLSPGGFLIDCRAEWN